MEPVRFNALVQTLTRPGSRRRALGVVFAAALAPAAAAATPAPAACLALGKRCSQPTSGAAHGKGKKGKHHPPSCSKCCSRFGAADPNGKPRCTCKGEGAQCVNDSECCGGQCRQSACTGCPAGTVFCIDGCADLQTNSQHCGSCANACASGQRCQDRQCVCDATSCPTGCCAGTNCMRGTSASACGNNGATCQACPSGQRCDGTNCVCVPTTCAKEGKNCGMIGDGCGSILDCGACTAPDACGGGGTPSVCGCTKKTCAAGQCGTVDDGCGGTHECECPTCQTCNGTVCTADSALTHTCAGPCSSGQWCDAGQCAEIAATVRIPDCQGLCGGSATVCGQTATCPSCLHCADQTGCISPCPVADGPAGSGSYCVTTSSGGGQDCTTNADCPSGLACAFLDNPNHPYQCVHICPF